MMSKIALAGLVAIAGIGAGAALVAFKGPNMRPAPNVKVPMTAERIERGRYLFEYAADCDGCHSPRRWDLFSAPSMDETRASGFAFPPELGFPGQVVAPNITPDAETGIGTWTDGEKIRAIREGVTKNGDPLFSFMPYQAFAAMSDEDVESIVAYMNTLKPVRNRLPRTRLDFPVNVLSKFEPAPLSAPVSAPPRHDKVNYGAYLVRIGSCITCHTQLDKGVPIAGKEFSGGEPFAIAGFFVRSANITPDEETGIGKWTEERFVSKFKNFAHMTPETAPKHVQANFTLMPWSKLAQLHEDDLRAIYAYLRTIKPIYHSVEIHPPAAN